MDILGTELAASPFTWLTTKAGIRFLPVGTDVNLFLLPDPLRPPGQFFQGRVEGTNAKASVSRLDNGSTDPAVARKAMEDYAATTDFTYNSRGASWRRTPASEAQLNLLRRMGEVAPEGIKKGEASDMLAVAKVSRILDGRFGKYVTTA